MVKWDDTAPHKFLKRFGRHSKDHKDRCEAASKRLKYKFVNLESIIRKNYNLYPERLLLHASRYDRQLSIGTFFCRPRRKDNKRRWMLKDGNHRFLMLVIRGEKRFRIAYDPDDEV